MIQNPNPQFPMAPPGTIKIYPHKALITVELLLLQGKLKVFCKARLGKGVQESAPDERNDRNPSWNQELGFRRVNETQLKFELYHKTFLIKPTLLGECTYDLDQLFLRGQLTETRDLFYDGKNAGSFTFSLKWEPEARQPVFPVYPAFTQPLVFPPSNFNNMNFAPQRVVIPQSAFQQGGGVVVRLPSYDDSVIGAQRPQIYAVRPGTAAVSSGSNLFMDVNTNANFKPMAFAPSGNLTTEQIEKAKKEAEKPSEQNLSDDQKCVVCLEGKKEGAFYRCGHNCCCIPCGIKFVGAPCPICRQIVLDFIKVYDA